MLTSIRRIPIHFAIFVAGVGLALLAILLISATLAADPVEVPAHGCQYDDDSIDPIEYRFFSVGEDYVTAFKDAEAEWDATSAPGYFREKSLSVDPEINVYDNWRWGTWDARTSWETPCASDDTYHGNEVTIEFNTRMMDNIPAREKEIIAIHELGHAYGLDHIDTTECDASVMTQSEAIFECDDLPTSNDVDAVTDIYD